MQNIRLFTIFPSLRCWEQILDLSMIISLLLVSFFCPFVKKCIQIFYGCRFQVYQEFSFVSVSNIVRDTKMNSLTDTRNGQLPGLLVLHFILMLINVASCVFRFVFNYSAVFEEPNLSRYTKALLIMYLVLSVSILSLLDTMNNL